MMNMKPLFLMMKVIMKIKNEIHEDDDDMIIQIMMMMIRMMMVITMKIMSLMLMR